MYRVQLKPKLQFKIDDREYEIMRISNNGLIEVIDLKYNDIRQYQESELATLLSQGKLKFAVKGKNIKLTDNGISTEYELPDISENKYLEVASFRYRVILPLLKDSSLKGVLNRVEEINTIIDTYSKDEAHEIFECSYFKKVSKSGIYRWISQYKKSEGDIRSLLPSYHKCGGKNKHRLDSIVVSIIEEAIEEEYKTQNRINISELHELIKEKIVRHNTYATEKVKWPSLSTISRFIKSIPEYEILLKRHSKRTADINFKMVGNGVKVHLPLERVEIDATPIDILLKTENSTKGYARPNLIAAIDKFSRNIVGFSIGLGSVGATEVMQCIRHIMMDKSYVKNKYPDIKNEWNAFGIPQNLVTDRGMEFNNSTLKDAALQCGFILQQCPPRTPEWKGSIERYFGTLNRNLIHNMPGTTRSNPQCLSEEENPIENASVGFCLFVELVHKWIIDVYSQSYHTGIKGIPAKIWNEGIRKHRPAWPNDIGELAILLGKVSYRKIRRTGIQLNNLYYNSIELNELLHKLSSKELDVRVKVKYDPNDISYIYVLDTIIENRWLKIPSTDLGYTTGLSEMEHVEICKIAKEKFGIVDEIALAKAKRDIYDKMSENVEFIQKTRKKKTNSNNEILSIVDTDKFLLPLQDGEKEHTILNLGYEYTPMITSNAVIISNNKTKEKSVNKNQSNKKFKQEKEAVNVNGIALNKDQIVKENKSLDDIDLSDYNVI